jgi:hypothetical protein
MSFPSLLLRPLLVECMYVCLFSFRAGKLLFFFVRNKKKKEEEEEKEVKT